jgi:hypothetical protein
MILAMSSDLPPNITSDGYQLLVLDGLTDERTQLTNGQDFPPWADLSGLPPEQQRFELPILRLRLEVEEGQVVLTQLDIRRAVEDSSITASTLRFLKVDELIRAGVAVVLMRMFADQRLASGWRPSTPDERSRIADLAERANQSRHRRVVTDALLHQVANIYRANEAGAPTIQVAEQLFTSHRNATRWVALARERGFLPPYREASWVNHSCVPLRSPDPTRESGSRVALERQTLPAPLPGWPEKNRSPSHSCRRRSDL